MHLYKRIAHPPKIKSSPIHKHIAPLASDNEPVYTAGMLILRWTPRVLAICYIVFLSMFALDVFSEPSASLAATVTGLSLHLLPSLILLVLTIIAWKKAAIGGALFMILALAFTLFFHTYESLPSLLTISVPPLLIGLLFVADAHFRRFAVQAPR